MRICGLTLRQDQAMSVEVSNAGRIAGMAKGHAKRTKLVIDVGHFWDRRFCDCQECLNNEMLGR
jgi:hypothetical protein